jgi:N-acetylglucosaminyl-diphospho-decaprenol L-rhamnosyltransferase
MPSAGPLVTVSVVSHGDGAALKCLLSSFGRVEDRGRLELILTDNLGKDVPDLAVKGWQSLRMLRNPSPQGYARNHNAAFGYAHGEYFCVLNPDVELLEPTLAPLIAVLQNGGGEIAAPLVVDPEGHVQDSFRRLPTPGELVSRWIGRGVRRTEPPAESLHHPDWVAGIFMLMRRDTFSILHGFDPRYRIYFEDVELCTRARLEGLSVVVDTRLRVRHDARRASRRSGRYLAWHVQSAISFFSSETYRRARRIQRDHA